MLIMDRICCVIDMEGFRVNGRFLPRELGWVGVRSSAASSVGFNLCPFAKDISYGDQNHIDYATKHVHGLKFEPIRGEEVYELEVLGLQVLKLYDVFKSRNKNLIAYKGGQVEKKLLDTLFLPSIDLETLGCPRYDDLKGTRYYCSDTCGYHVNNLHCPRAEVTTFLRWVYAQLPDESYCTLS